MINPGMMMKLMNAKNTFESNHPKFAAFVSRFFMGGAITEGTIIEITITRDVYKRQAYMRASGNPNQWNGAYPDPETLRTDMEKQRLYVYKKNGRIHGVFMLLLEEEPTYAYIEAVSYTHLWKSWSRN